jgi:N-acetyl-gamma-glutamyl-phosphate reductase
MVTGIIASRKKVNMKNKIKIGIVGGAGYTGGELLRLLLQHPQAEIAFVHSKSNAGKLISDVHTDLVGDTGMKFTDKLNDDVQVIFLCVGHGEAMKFLAENKISGQTKIIDLSQDHRIEQKRENGTWKWVYGLPELNKKEIASASFIANPGCFATAIQLGLLPLAAEKKIKNEVHVSATTGSTGAGQSLSGTSHFSWRQNNLNVYKAFEHQHLGEIGQSLLQLQADLDKGINFIPYRGSFTRGIMANMYLQSDLSLENAKDLFVNYYEAQPFVHISGSNIDLKQVVNTNKCLLNVAKHGDKLMITSVIDNLLKGASGQAVQNMNLMFGLEETSGLKLKASYF